ncbi:MAG: methyltransferase domain-containing protein [Nanoarchaeota archaeon]
MRNPKIIKKKYKRIKFPIEYPVLDICGGDGAFLKYKGCQKATIIGYTDDKNRDYDYIEQDITKKLPDLRKKFKTIFLMETLEHIKNPLYLMAQVYDLLDNDGTCYISVPYTKLFPKRREENKYQNHLVRWKKKELIKDMDRLGFKVQVLQQRRRFKNTAFWLPHCWVVLKLTKRLKHTL